MSTIPTISINGTSRDALLDDAKAAHRQCLDFLHTLRSTKPHGRDYQGRQEDFVAARRERDELIRRVVEIQHELEARLIAIYDGGHKS